MPRGINVAETIYTPNVREWRKHGEPLDEVPRYVGVEIEFHDFAVRPTAEQERTLKGVVTHWGGSIGQDHANVEIRLAPARGVAFYQQVDEVCDALRPMRPTVNAGCGLHLHIDANDLKYSGLGRVMVAYSKMEPLLVKTQPYSRMCSKFCKPTGSALGEGWSKARLISEQEVLFKEKAKQIVNPAELNGNGRQAAERYKAVNFAAWYKYGTVEVRFHEGTVRAEDIASWGRFWAMFVEWSSKTSLPDLKRVKRSLTALRDAGIDADCIAERIRKYRDQWTPARVQAIIPVAPVEP